jgi:hypothetical protein
MPVIVKETRRSKSHTSGSNLSAKREYTAWGSADGDAIEIAIEAIAPATVNGLVVDSAEFTPRDEDETVWDAIFTYTKAKTREQPKTNDEEISFELGSQTVKVRQSFNTVARYAKPGDTATNFKGGIGYDSEKKGFEGADKFVEAFTFSITKYFPKSIVENPGYIQSLRNCAFKTNNAPFRGFAAGEVIFVGASGSKRSADDYAVTYKFMAGANAAGLALGDIVGITKAAWDYLWVVFHEVADETSNPKFLKQEPLFAYVEQLYFPANFPTYLGVAA